MGFKSILKLRNLHASKKTALNSKELRAAIWRRGPESNRPTRICNPVHNRFATAPFLVTKKGSCCFPNLQKDVGSSFNVWSGIRGSNSRPIPWQGIALPTELIPHLQSTEHSMPNCLRWTNCSVIFGNFKSPPKNSISASQHLFL